MASPPEKKQNTGEELQVVKPLGKVAEPPKELETDAGPVKGSPLSEPVAFSATDATLNVLPSSTGLLMTLNENGLQQLAAGSRANVGITTGRYFFEVKAVECFGQFPMLMVGFSTAGSSLMVGTSAEGIAFDCDGRVLHNRKPTGQHKVHRNAVFGVLLNLDVASTNACTISLFKDGKRVTQPQPLPKELVGKVLFPHVCFRGVTVFANFGPEPMAPLPFMCHMLQQASQAHCTIAKTDSSGKHEVVYPVSLPDEGTFDWLDTFKEKHPEFTELSDRMILDWVDKSGMAKPGHKSSNDKPEIQGMDASAIRRAVYMAAPLQPRSYIVMEVKSNLLKDDRAKLLDHFADPAFKKVATVVVGEPTSDFKKKSHDMTRKRKQTESDRQFHMKKAEEKRHKLVEKRKRESDKKRRAALKEAKKKARAQKKAQLAAKKAKGEKVEELPESSDEEAEEADAEDPLADVEEEPPRVDLDAEDKKKVFFEHPVKDLTVASFNQSFAKFSMPAKKEGFDDIRYEWSKGDACQGYLRKWVLDKKLHLRVEDIAPGVWSGKMQRQWLATVNQWHGASAKYKQKAGADAKTAVEKAKAAEQAAKSTPKPEKDAAPDAEPEADKEPIDFSRVDVFAAQDVLDVGAGMPLFKEWGSVDWAMLSLRFELYVLAHAFKKDVKDEERPGVHVDHIPFYFQRYFHRVLNYRDYGVDSFLELLKLVGDTVYLTDQSVLQSWLPDEMETFAAFGKLVEDARRHRSLRLLIGEETAQLKLAPRLLTLGQPAQQTPQRPAQPKLWGGTQVAARTAGQPPKAGAAAGAKGLGKGAVADPKAKAKAGVSGSPAGLKTPLLQRPGAAAAKTAVSGALAVKKPMFQKPVAAAGKAGAKSVAKPVGVVKPGAAAAGAAAAQAVGAAGKGAALGKGVRPTAVGAGTPAATGKGTAAGKGLRPTAASAAPGKGLRPTASVASAKAGNAAASATSNGITRPGLATAAGKGATGKTQALGKKPSTATPTAAVKGSSGKAAAKGWGSGGSAWGCGGAFGKGGKW